MRWHAPPAMAKTTIPLCSKYWSRRQASRSGARHRIKYNIVMFSIWVLREAAYKAHSHSAEIEPMLQCTLSLPASVHHDAARIRGSYGAKHGGNSNA